MARQIDYAGVVLSLDPEREERQQVRAQLQWDYSQVSPLHRKAVEDAAVEIAVAGRQMQSSVLSIGAALVAAKGLLAHGQFEEWCRIEFGMSQRTAQNMMNVARTFDGKSEKISLLGDSVLYLLAAPSTPEPVREAMIEQAESAGRVPSVAKVRQAIQDAKPARLSIPLSASVGAETDDWVAAWEHRRSEAFEERVRRLAAVILPWAEAWTDGGRTWRDVVERNPQHANSPFRQDLDRECRRRGLLMAGGALAAVIEAVFVRLLDTGEAEPAVEFQVWRSRIEMMIRELGDLNVLLGHSAEVTTAARALRKVIARVEKGK